MVTGTQLTSKEVKLLPLHSKAFRVLLPALDKKQFRIWRITVYHKVYNSILYMQVYKRREFSDSGKELYNNTVEPV